MGLLRSSGVCQTEERCAMMGSSQVPLNSEGSVMAGRVRVKRGTLQSTAGDRSREAWRSRYRVPTSDIRIMKSRRNVLSKGVT